MVGFDIVKNGTWPEEKYTITLDNNIIDPALHDLPAENLFRFDAGWMLPINFLSKFEYKNAATTFDSEGLIKIDTFSNTSLVWNVSSERIFYNKGYTFNSFSIDLLNGARQPNKFCSYSLYPERLCLKPTNPPYKDISGNWVLTTEPVLFDSRKYSYIKKSYPDVDVSTNHIQLLSYSPTTLAIPANSNYSIVYNLCAVRTRVDRNVIDFVLGYNPSTYSVVLEPTPSSIASKSKIRIDSTFVTYNVDYYAKDDTLVNRVWNLGQARYDVRKNDLPTLKSSYIINSNDLLNKNVVTYQLVQVKEDGNLSIPLGDSRYCVLSSTFNLEDSNFTYYNKNTIKAGGTVVNWTTGVEDTFIGVSYIADCAAIKHTNEIWQDTVVETQNFELGVPIACPSLTDITWKTKYPPHYYSYKASLIKNSDPSKKLETFGLTFYVNSEILSGGYTNTGYTTSFCLSTYIHSDYKFIEYGLSTGADTEYIKFSPTVNRNSVFLSSLTGFYGTDLSIPYSFVDTPWVPASACNRFEILYPEVTHGELDFSIRPSLSTVAGQIDAIDATRINLAIGQPPANKGNKIFTIALQETQDYIEVDSSFLINDAGWPSRNLIGSKISWDIEPKTSYTKIYSIDKTNGNYIQDITPLASYTFNSNTQTIAVVGYGPITTGITLSSQKYNETTTLSTNSALFDFFAEGVLLVGPSKDLNNINEIRTITLTAAVPYKGRIYELPYNTQLDWTWTYNGVYNENTTPISAYSTNTGELYEYARNNFSVNSVSSVDFKIQPALNSVALLNDVYISCSIDSQNGLLEGYYDFTVDDFPNRNLLNSYFTVRYQDFINILAYTKESNDAVVTRKNNGTNQFEVEMVSDYSSLPSADIYWYISTEEGGVVTEYSPLAGSTLVPINLTAVSVTKVSLCALNILIAGWTLPHSIESNCTFYILDPIEFDKPLEFISFPEFHWKYADDKVTILNNTNYSLLTANEVYGNIKGRYQSFYLSANKDSFNDYDYYRHIGYNKFEQLDGLDSYYGKLDIPYNEGALANEEIYITLTAYNDTSFPRKNGITYLSPVTSTSGPSTIQNFYFNIISETDFTSTNVLRRPPLITPYPKITYTFTPSNTAIDIDVTRNITITQTMSSSVPNSPAKNIGGTITYILSSVYWVAYKNVPAIDSTFSVFNLFAGNPIDFLTVHDSKTSTLLLYASSDINAKIPATTFDNYPYPLYDGIRDLWSIENQKTNIRDGLIIKTSSKIATPEIYLSTTYALTGEELYVQYDAPTVVDPGYEVVAYATDFGEDDSTYITPFDVTVKHSYENVGTYFIRTTAFYQNNLIKTFIHENPFYIKPEWDTYDPEDLRFVEETILTYPNDKVELSIQPNEWGDADIFNTSILRIQENLDYLKSNLKTLDTLSPTTYFGWLGTNLENPFVGLRWFTKDYLNVYHETPVNATSNQLNSFKRIKDIVETANHIFVLHNNTTLTILSGGAFAPVLNLENIKTLEDVAILPTSIEVTEDETSMFMCDASRNRVYRFDLELNITNPKFNYGLSVGGLGKDEEPNRFNSPSELAYANDMVYVLDYNNYCIKQYNSNLSWIYTYYSDMLNNDNPVNIAVHPTSNLIYVLTKSNTVYIYEERNVDPITSFKLDSLITDIVKLVFDEVGDFLYVVTKTAIYKHSPTGYFFTELVMPENITYTSGIKSSKRSLLFSTENAIIKVQDILKTHQVGRGLPKKYWDKNQLTISRNEFASDTNYNRCLVRMAQNIKTFRNSLNYKLAIVTEETATTLITYLATVPLNVNSLPIFDDKMEKETIGIGVNELHTPQVVNRELNILNKAMDSLKSIFDIQPLSRDEFDGVCSGEFCWSWEATSCYKLEFPIIKVCSINPITFKELNGSVEFSETAVNVWKDAVSTCCENMQPPI